MKEVLTKWSCLIYNRTLVNLFILSYCNGEIFGIGFISLAKFQHDFNSVKCWAAHSMTSEWLVELTQVSHG
jgi:hypothetical protein